MNRSLFSSFLLAAALWTTAARSEDWPQFLGPRRNGSSEEKIADSWASSEPKQLWKKSVGAGFAGPVVLQETVLLFHRQANSEVLTAFEAATGKLKWENKKPTSYRDDFGFDEGPRAVPTIDEGRVYAMGAEGLVRCVSFADGKDVWSVPAMREFKANKGFFGMACSPLVTGDLVILNIGGAQSAGIVAFEKTTGKVRWKATDQEASYASPVLMAFEGKSDAVVFTREGLVILEAASGKEVAQFPWRSRMNASVNAATPLVVGNNIFLSASYDTGAVLLERVGPKLKKIWSGDESLSSHYATPVYHDGYLYGFHGRQEMGPSFRCVEFATGKVAWSQDAFGAGSAIIAGENLLILKESGELLLAQASPKGFRSSGATHILGSGTRAYPALSHGRLYGRDKTALVAITLP